METDRRTPPTVISNTARTLLAPAGKRPIAFGRNAPNRSVKMLIISLSTANVSVEKENVKMQNVKRKDVKFKNVKQEVEKQETGKQKNELD